MESTKQVTYREKLIRLYFEQKKTLDLFLERGAISQEQYNKSFGDLTAKMKIDELAQDKSDH
jgi:hypothetical protein